MAVQDDFEVAWLPLNKKLRSYSEFDSDKLNLWFKQHKNAPYSRVAAFFAAVDTENQSFPAPINAESVPVILRLYAQFSDRLPTVAGGEVMDQLIEALDKRIRTVATAEQLKSFPKAKRIEEIVQFASEELNMSLTGLMAIPESSEWLYDNYDGKPVFSPASFVVGALQQLGVFHGIEITPEEFTVTDVYQLDIYEKEESERPDLCREADYGLPFCQLFGTYRLELPGFSSVPPYDRMNENCPNAFEYRARPDTC